MKSERKFYRGVKHCVVCSELPDLVKHHGSWRAECTLCNTVSVPMDNARDAMRRWNMCHILEDPDW